MIVWKNGDSLYYHANFGTVFKADRADLQSGVKVEHPHYLDAGQRLRDCFEFGGWHGANVHPYLNGFAGYDAVRFEVSGA